MNALESLRKLYTLTFWLGDLGHRDDGGRLDGRGDRRTRGSPPRPRRPRSGRRIAPETGTDPIRAPPEPSTSAPAGPHRPARMPQRDELERMVNIMIGNQDHGPAPDASRRSGAPSGPPRRASSSTRRRPRSLGRRSGIPSHRRVRPRSASPRRTGSRPPRSSPATRPGPVVRPDAPLHRVTEGRVNQDQDRQPIDHVDRLLVPDRPSSRARGRHSWTHDQRQDQPAHQVEDHVPERQGGPPPLARPSSRARAASGRSRAGSNSVALKTAAGTFPRAAAVIATDEETVEGNAHRKKKPSLRSGAIRSPH